VIFHCFSLSIKDLDVSVLPNIITFIALMILEIYVPFYFCNELSVASSKLSAAVFHSNWIKKTQRYKNSMLILMENLKKDMKINAFGVFDVSLDNFLKIVNSAYSLFALLKKLNSK
jgi:odorant receptor